jgi:acyl carrier protein
MTRNEITEKLTDVFRDVFDDDSIVIREDMTAKDVQNWDSISHVDMICGVEAAFDIQLTTRQVAVLKTVGELISVIEQKKHPTQGSPETV